MYAEIFHWMREARIYELREPKPGLRHNKSPQIIQHRFPIKNGLTWRETMVRISQKRNLLLDLVRLEEPSTEMPTSET